MMQEKMQDLIIEQIENDDLEKIKLEEYETENIEILKITISKSKYFSKYYKN